jgi:LCP family protein required for cell wall assembly
VPADDDQRPEGREDRPAYKVYRSKPSLLSRLRAPDLERLRHRERKPRRPRPSLAGPAGSRWRRRLVYGALAWLALSFVLFAVSAQIQNTKLDGDAKDLLGGSPNLVTDPQTILVLGGDQREEGQAEPGSDPNDPVRADTIMLIRAGGTKFRKLSIPRDSLAEIPGHGSQKINAAFAFDDPNHNGNAALMIQTVQAFLGIDVDHVVIVDFAGFEDFIDAIGGVKVEVKSRVCSDIHGGRRNGGLTLRLSPGTHTLNGKRALILARTRLNSCGPADDDRTRAARQQLILSGIKGRLTSPLRLPYNFIKGPIIGWTAPKAIVSDLGGLTMPQLVLAALIGNDSDPEVLVPSGAGPGATLIISAEERQRGASELLG